MPEYTIIIDEFTYGALGKMARHHDTTLGGMVELLVMQEIVRDALHGELSLSNGGLRSIMERLRHVPDSLHP